MSSKEDNAQALYAGQRTLPMEQAVQLLVEGDPTTDFPRYYEAIAAPFFQKLECCLEKAEARISRATGGKKRLEAEVDLERTERLMERSRRYRQKIVESLPQFSPGTPHLLKLDAVASQQHGCDHYEKTALIQWAKSHLGIVLKGYEHLFEPNPSEAAATGTIHGADKYRLITLYFVATALARLEDRPSTSGVDEAQPKYLDEDEEYLFPAITQLVMESIRTAPDRTGAPALEVQQSSATAENSINASLFATTNVLARRLEEAVAEGAIKVTDGKSKAVSKFTDNGLYRSRPIAAYLCKYGIIPSDYPKQLENTVQKRLDAARTHFQKNGLTHLSEDQLQTCLEAGARYYLESLE